MLNAVFQVSELTIAVRHSAVDDLIEKVYGFDYMSGLPPQHSTLTVAQESLKMGKETGDRSFKIMAMGLMAMTGLATMFHALHTIWRDMREDRKHGRDAGRSQLPPEQPVYTAAASGDDTGPQRRWANRPELAERKPAADHAQAAHRHPHSRGRHH